MEETLNNVLQQLEFLSEELGDNTKQEIVILLQNIINDVYRKNNLVEIKAAFAKDNLKDKYKLEYVSISDTYNFVVIPLSYSSIRHIKDEVICFESPRIGCQSIYNFCLGPTEDMAWCNAYNKLLAIQR
jgi:hypothetical protein